MAAQGKFEKTEHLHKGGENSEHGELTDGYMCMDVGKACQTSHCIRATNI